MARFSKEEVNIFGSLHGANLEKFLKEDAESFFENSEFSSTFSVIDYFGISNCKFEVFHTLYKPWSLSVRKINP